MIIWLLITGFDIPEFYFPIKEDQDFFNGIKGQFETHNSIIDTWPKPILLRKDPKIHPDFFEMPDSDVIAISERAFLALKNFNISAIEFLPIVTDCGLFYALNLISHLHCLDIDSSDLTLSSNGKVVQYDNLCFLTDLIPNDQIVFKIPEMPYTIFTTDLLQETCEYHGLIGLEFDPNVNLIWEK